MTVILISLGIHLLALLIFGSYTLVKIVLPDEAEFEEPPAVEEVEPPPDVKVEIKPQAAPQEQAMQNLRMKQVGNIAVAAVDVDLPSMDQSFTVSSGLGGFGGGGSLLGNTRGSIGLGVSDINVFGLQTRAERVLFVIDANRHMVTDKKGGLNSYNIIKDEITDMVGNLSTGTLFNVMIVDRRRSMLFKPQLVPAGLEVHQELVEWMRPINQDAKDPGLEGVRGAARPQTKTLKDEAIHKDINWSGHRGNETSFMTQVALEQGVDAIFFVTGYHRGFERVRRRLTEIEQADWERTISRRSYKEQLAEHEAEIPIMRRRIDDKLAEINKERREKGLPPRVLSKRHGIYTDVRELDLKWETEHPGFRPVYWRDTRDVERYFKKLIDVLYEDKDRERPTVNVILFLAGDEEMRDAWEDQLGDYVDFFRGDYRIIRGLDEIESARSARETKN